MSGKFSALPFGLSRIFLKRAATSDGGRVVKFGTDPASDRPSWWIVVPLGLVSFFSCVFVFLISIGAIQLGEPPAPTQGLVRHFPLFSTVIEISGSPSTPLKQVLFDESYKVVVPENGKYRGFWFALPGEYKPADSPVSPIEYRVLRARINGADAEHEVKQFRAGLSALGVGLAEGENLPSESLFTSLYEASLPLQDEKTGRESFHWELPSPYRQAGIDGVEVTVVLPGYAVSGEVKAKGEVVRYEAETLSPSEVPLLKEVTTEPLGEGVIEQVLFKGKLVTQVRFKASGLGFYDSVRIYVSW